MLKAASLPLWFVWPFVTCSLRSQGGSLLAQQGGLQFQSSRCWERWQETFCSSPLHWGTTRFIRALSKRQSVPNQFLNPFMESSSAPPWTLLLTWQAQHLGSTLQCLTQIHFLLKKTKLFVFLWWQLLSEQPSHYGKTLFSSNFLFPFT